MRTARSTATATADTNDGLEIVGQFGGITLGLGLFAEALGSDEGLDYIAPDLIERFIFEDGTSLEFTEIVEQVLENAKTTGDDAIYGMLNDNTLDGGAGDDYLPAARAPTPTSTAAATARTSSRIRRRFSRRCSARSTTPQVHRRPALDRFRLPARRHRATR